MTPLKPAAELAAAASKPYPNDSADVPRARAPRCSPRRSSCGATSSASPRSGAPCRRAARRRDYAFQRRERPDRRRSPTCSASTTRWSPTSGCTARSASGRARCAPSFLGALDIPARDISQRVAFAVIGRSPVERQLAFARERGWRNLRSSHGRRRFRARLPRPRARRQRMAGARRLGQARRQRAPLLGRRAGRHRDPGQDPRGAPDPTPLWNLLDLTPGRARHRLVPEARLRRGGLTRARPARRKVGRPREPKGGLVPSGAGAAPGEGSVVGAAGRKGGRRKRRRRRAGRAEHGRRGALHRGRVRRRAVTSRISRTVAPGASQCGKWPQCSNQCSRASGKSASARSACAGGQRRSPRPQPITSGCCNVSDGAPRCGSR